MTEGVDGEKKMEVEEATKTQKMEENNVTEPVLIPESIKVEVVPIVTDIFTETDDLLNITPLKVAMAISAQHLLTTLQNLPVSGNDPEGTLTTFNSIVDEFNRTAQIIKLTADYVNISGHYILSTLNSLTQTSCDQIAVRKAIKSVNQNFLKIISNHIKSAVKEVNNKTKKREVTASDILVSSAYHIVRAFQDMTNQILSLADGSNKSCVPSLNVSKTPTNSKEVGDEEKNNNDNIFINIQTIPEQGKVHKSIKKDQAVPKPNSKWSETDFDKFQGNLPIQNENGNQDLTVEIFSPEAYMYSNQKKLANKNQDENTLKVPQRLNNYYPDIISPDFKSKNNEEPARNINQGENNEKKEIKSEILDGERNLPLVDNLNSKTWTNAETKNFEKNNFDKENIKTDKKAFQSIPDILQLLSPRYQYPSQFAQKQKVCDENVEPVCGIDKNSKKFLIFLNDCKREVHNKEYGTNYKWSNMDTCVSLFLQTPDRNVPSSVNKPNTFVDLRPR